MYFFFRFPKSWIFPKSGRGGGGGGGRQFCCNLEYVNLTCWKWSYVETTVDLFWFCTVCMKPVEPKTKISSTHSSGKLFKSFHKKIESIYQLLPLKGHFGFSGFQCLAFLLEDFDPKIASRVRYLQKIEKYPDGRTDGRTSKFEWVPHKAIRAINSTV